MTNLLFKNDLVEMFQSLMTISISRMPPEFLAKGQTQSYWAGYRGPDCAPFNAYIRFGRDHITLANIHATRVRGQKTAAERQGRMPIIVAAMRSVASDVTIECIVAQSILSWSLRNGFEPIEGSPMTVRLKHGA